MKSLTVLAALWPLLASPTLSQAAELNVPATFPTIQSAIDSAVAGDVVRVDAGTYFESLDFMGKAIIVESVNGPGVTTIEGWAYSGVVRFESGEGRTSVLRGFQLRNGQSGVYISNASPTIEGNHILDNRGCTGIGIRSEFGSPLIRNNLIEGNLPQGCSGGSGGGIYIGGSSNAEIVGNTIRNNYVASGVGGGIALVASGPTLVQGNVIGGNSSDVRGGGIWIADDSPASIVQNIIDNNYAPEGGGIYFLVPPGGSGPTLISNTMVYNTADEGSAVFADGFDAQVLISNNILFGFGPARLLYCGSSNDPNPPIIEFNDVFNFEDANYGGLCTDRTGISGNISAEPIFADLVMGDYHLLTGSPGIESGDSSAPGLPPTDFDGNPRLTDGDGDGVDVLDLGVYERPGRLDTPVEVFVTQAKDGQVVLEWANPTLVSPFTTMIRYSTADFPVDETDGTLLVERSGSATDRYVHFTPNGTEVFYSAFVNQAGVFSAGVTTRATPIPTNGPIKWAYTTGATNLEPPGIGFGEVASVSNDNRLHNLSGGTNGGDWMFAPVALNDAVMHRPTISPYPVGAASTAILVSTPDGFVNAIDGADGSVVWTSPNLGMVMGAPSISFSQFGGTDEVFVGTRVAGGVNAMYALDLNTGVERWRFDAGGLGTGIISGQAQVDVTNTRLFFGSWARSVAGDPTLWCISHVGGVPVEVWAVDVGDVDGSPILAHGRIYVGNNAGELVAVDAMDGAELWRLPLGDGPIKGYVAVDFGSNNLYVSTTNTVWSVSDGTLGTPASPSASINWSNATIPNPSTPFYGSNRVWVGAGDGRLCQLNAGGSGSTCLQVAPFGTALGTPGVNVAASLFHLGAENGVLYSVEVPLP